MSNTNTIARNTGWYGLESAISSILTLFTSIAIARTLGPTKMGYIVYVTWIVSVVSGLGGLGIPATTRKYMAEYLGMGDQGTARYIYIRTMMLQAGLAGLATISLVIWVLRDATGEYKLASVLIVLSIWPAMVNSISAQANVATEELSRNMPASVVSISIFFVMILSTVVFHWGVIGVGASMFLMRLIDFLVRIFPTVSRILAWDSNHVTPEGLSKRMLTFAWQSVATMIVALIVWDRSEFILLKHLCSDIRQVTYYSVAFTMAEWLLVGSSIFGSAASATIFAQYGRDKSRVPDITASTFRYLVIMAIPLHFISAALSSPALLFVYGKQYTGAAAVVTLSPLLCLPKAFFGPVQSLLQSYERQTFIIVSTILASIIDFGVAWLLIPAHGAVGACIGSGTAQLSAVAILWFVCIRFYKLKLPWVLTAKVTFISTLAALTAHFIALLLPPLMGILCGGIAALAATFGLFYLLRVLRPVDRNRFAVLCRTIPKPFAGPVQAVLFILIRPEFNEAA
jgi:O-antigen/teichoic acid export membrane protein